jgi:hypothetical protein
MVIKFLNQDGTEARIAITEDGEVWTTVTERENDVWIEYSQQDLNADAWIVLVDIDNPDFPHSLQKQPQNRIDVTAISYSIDVALNTKAILRYGVITRIDAINSDIRYFVSIPFLTGAQQEDRTQTLRMAPSQLKLDCADGKTLHGLTNVVGEDVAAVNTSVLLDSSLGAGTVYPGIGDLILKYNHISGSSSLSTFLFYHTH